MREFATSIVRELRQRGFQAYFAGGCVRDTLLRVEPADYDVTTDAKPDQVMRIFPKTYAVGAKFGVVLVPIPEEMRYETLPAEHPHAVEVATFRSDGIYSDGRHPDQVQYSKSPEEDVQRRDFTINGLLMDPLEGDRVLDFVGGRKDLERAHCPGDWRTGAALPRGQVAHAARGALCGAVRLRRSSR